MTHSAHPPLILSSLIIIYPNIFASLALRRVKNAKRAPKKEGDEDKSTWVPVLLSEKEEEKSGKKLASRR